MLDDMIQALMEAKTPKEKELAYRNLERVGMDRTTANVVASEKRKEMNYGNVQQR